jgi:TetR/AcrR family transcriptional repressor of nem operon
MAGAKQFDLEHVLEKAMLVFWEHGFEGTSIQDLEAATGLGRGSLYNAFGDKAAIFLEVLSRYSARFGAPPLRHLAHEQLRDGLERTLRAQVERLLQPGVPQGCLMINTALAGSMPDAIAARVQGAVKGMEAAFSAAFERARAAGQLSPALDVTAIAQFYASVMVSLAAIHKAGSGREMLVNVVEVAMRAYPV